MKISRFAAVSLSFFALVPLSFAIADGVKKKRASSQQSQERLFRLGVALLQYSDDYDGKLPPMTDAKVARKALYSYAFDTDFFQPGTTKPWQPNPALSGRKHAEVSDEIVAFYAAKPAKDGARDVLLLPPFDPKIVHYESNSGFVRDSVKSLSKAEWQQVKPAEK